MNPVTGWGKRQEAREVEPPTTTREVVDQTKGTVS